VSTLTFGRRSATRDMTTAALLAALLAASAWISIPLGTVPLTLQVLVVMLVGLVLPPARALAAMAVYLLLGAIGVPVFSGGQGGLGVLAGPTGGYLLGFLVGAVFVALVRRSMSAGVPPWVADSAGAFVGLVIIYTLGWAQLALVTGMGPFEAFVAGVVPFAFADVLKAIAAVLIVTALRGMRLATP